MPLSIGKLLWLAILTASTSGCAGMAFSHGAPDLEARMQAATDDSAAPAGRNARNAEGRRATASTSSPRSKLEPAADTSAELPPPARREPKPASAGDAAQLQVLAEAILASTETSDGIATDMHALADSLALLPPDARGRLAAAIRDARPDTSADSASQSDGNPRETQEPWPDDVSPAPREQRSDKPRPSASGSHDSARNTTLRIKPASDWPAADRPEAARRSREAAEPPLDSPPADSTAAGRPGKPAEPREPHAALNRLDGREHAPGARAESHLSAESRVAALHPTVPTAGGASADAARRASHAADDEADWWNVHLERAIRSLEQETQGEPGSASGAARHAMLRLLYLVDGQTDQATRPISGVSPTQQDFWSKQLFTLHVLLNTDRNPDARRRAGEAALHLREAAAKLGELANLSVQNFTLCSEVKGFGVYKPLPKYEVRPGQRLLMYAEIENFRSQPHDDGYRTAVQGSYQLLDSRGERVAAEEFAASEDQCYQMRRDMFVTYHVSLPTRLPAGAYTLQLTIEDAIGDKLGQSTLELTVPDR